MSPGRRSPGGRSFHTYIYMYQQQSVTLHIRAAVSHTRRNAQPDACDGPRTTASLIPDPAVFIYTTSRRGVYPLSLRTAYRRVYDSRHLQADSQEPGSAPKPYAGQSSTGYLFLRKTTPLLVQFSIHPAHSRGCSPKCTFRDHE